MIRLLHSHRFVIALLLAWGSFAWLWSTYPFPGPGRNPLLDVVHIHSPYSWMALYSAWVLGLFWLPFLYVFHPALANLRRMWPEKPGPVLGPLPAYPDPRRREELSVVIGELHHPDKIEPSATPAWLEIPPEGLTLGLLVLGSPGSGKSAGLVLPAAEQLFAYRAHDPAKRVGGLVLEVKGDLCVQVERILRQHGRAQDYVEIGLDSDYVYNPLHNDASPDALAFQIMALKKSLVGASKEPFWDDSAESLVTFLIIIYRLLYGYVTLFDIYEAAGDIQIIHRLMECAQQELAHDHILLDKQVVLDVDEDVADALKAHHWTNAQPHHLRAPHDEDLAELLAAHNVSYEVEASSQAPDQAQRNAHFRTATRAYRELKALEEKSPNLPGNIAKGLTVFLMIMDVNPTVRRIFCPPKEAYDPTLNKDFRYGRPLPPLSEVIETSSVIALKLPIAEDEKLARVMGTLLKQDWQRAVLNRIPDIQETPLLHHREVVMLIDEYHLLATAGGSRPIGDEKFLNLCRAAKCIPIVATQSISSLRDTIPAETWRTILQGFATTICLRQKDLFTAETISKMCGRIDDYREHYSFSEGSQDAKVSWATARTTANRSASINVSHSYNLTREYLFEPKLLMELPRGCAVVLANDGDEQLRPSIVYLSPHGQDPMVSYWSTRNRLKRLLKGAA